MYFNSISHLFCIYLFSSDQLGAGKGWIFKSNGYIVIEIHTHNKINGYKILYLR